MEKRNKRIPTVCCDFGRLGALLGESWGGLGPSWASWRRSKRHPKKERFPDPLNVESCAHLGSHLGSPNRPKTAPETSQNLRRFSNTKKSLFKTVLEPSWADLGPFWVPSWIQKSVFFHLFYYCFVKSNVFAKDTLSEQFLELT